MKVAKVLATLVLGIVVVWLAWGLVSWAFVFIVGAIKTVVGLAIGVAIIGGLGWLILRILGRKSLSSNKTSSLP
ncbi:MAG: hypothetical protein IIC73_05490 [Armatimonadetes bacterium]|nr:hypothetical protein [Armatimonadota bacterium]